MSILEVSKPLLYELIAVVKYGTKNIVPPIIASSITKQF